ncbi:MAG TPA: response regulator, partial [Terriglobales bacterium]
EFTGPRGEKARVYFENGQVRDATAPGKEGRAAFDEIVEWKGGHISEVPVPHDTPHTINLEWQVLLMEAVRKIDEAGSAKALEPAERRPRKTAAQKILVIDDSAMLLSFVSEILTENNYDVSTAATGEEGLRVCRANAPDLILLDYVLPDMKGDEVCRKLVADPATAQVPVVYMSGLGSDLQPNRAEIPNVIGALSKPFTSESLIKAVGTYLPAGESEPAEKKTTEPEVETPMKSSTKKETPRSIEPETRLDSLGKKEAEPTPAPPTLEEARQQTPVEESKPAERKADELAAPAAEPLPSRDSLGEKQAGPLAPAGTTTLPPIQEPHPPAISAPADSEPESEKLPDSNGAYFSGDSTFFSLHWALQTIAREKLTGALRAFWTRESVELLARDGRVVVATTQDPNLYCEESPVTLLNVERARIEAAREQQTRDGRPLFLTLANEGLILREPGLQLVQHYGQKLFSQLWTADRVRFAFRQEELPNYARDLPSAEDEIDQWALSTLRFVQYQELGAKAMVDASSVPAYTRDGYERVQQLRLTVAEAQFASQFNGVRSIVQISKNLRLDIKFARLTLFRFLALEIVECWPAQVAQKPEGRGGLRGIFGR